MESPASGPAHGDQVVHRAVHPQAEQLAHGAAE